MMDGATASFPFLSLPPEIRIKIYHLVVASPNRVLLLNPSGYCYHIPAPSYPTFPHGLLLTCQQIYHEARGLYFTVNDFDILLHKFEYSSLFFLDPTFRDNRLLVRSLRLRIWRWGSKDGFVKVLAPMVEDMILNGALRELEVGVKSSVLLGSAAQRLCHPHEGIDLRISDLKSYGMGPNVKALVKLCEDPYLERVQLVGFSSLSRLLEWFNNSRTGYVIPEEEDGQVFEDVTHLLDRSRWGG